MRPPAAVGRRAGESDLATSPPCGPSDGTMVEHADRPEIGQRQSSGYCRCSWWWASRRYSLHCSTLRQVEQRPVSSLTRTVGGLKLDLLLPSGLPLPIGLTARGTAQRWRGSSIFERSALIECACSDALLKGAAPRTLVVAHWTVCYLNLRSRLSSAVHEC